MTALARLEGKISAGEMAGLNARAKIDRLTEERVAAEFVAKTFGVEPRVVAESRAHRLWRRLAEHLTLVGISLLAAILVAIPLGVVAARRPRLGSGILAAAGIVQTIPSLALLVFMIPWLGIGAEPALVALFLYSLLPIIRNTATGLRDIPASLRESAEAMGLPPRTRLVQIELPMASRAILAGIKTAAVINVGTATIGALIGAGGFGQPILTGIRRDDLHMILFEGAIPAAVLALAVQGLFDLAERFLVPRGLRA
jgi:osmoprotectant transport system permease protein